MNQRRNESTNVGTNQPTKIDCYYQYEGKKRALFVAGSCLCDWQQLPEGRAVAQAPMNTLTVQLQVVCRRTAMLSAVISQCESQGRPVSDHSGVTFAGLYPCCLMCCGWAANYPANWHRPRTFPPPNVCSASHSLCWYDEWKGNFQGEKTNV